MPIALFGIDNDGINLVVNLLVLFLVVLWLALVWWTYTDARRRMEDPVLIACATAASIFPFAGTIVYMVVRPPEYLDDVRERELEIRAAEVRLQRLGGSLCPHCEAEVEPGFLRCPSCTRRLREPCVACGKPLDPRWRLCPYCEAEVVQAPPPPQVTRRASVPPPPEHGADRLAAERAAAERAAERTAAERAAERAERRRRRAVSPQ